MSLRRVGKPPKMYLFGGGNIGYSGASSMRVTTMDAKLDAFCSEDGETWTQINYNEGGGSSTVTQYSTQVLMCGVFNNDCLCTFMYTRCMYNRDGLRVQLTMQTCILAYGGIL